MPRVLVCDKLESTGLDLLREGGIELDNRPGLKDVALQEAVQAADGIIVRSGTRITAELLEKPGKLRAVVRAGVGVDNIDVAAATRKGIVVMNTPGGNTISTAEHTVAMMMSLARHLPVADASVHQGKWERGKFVGTQLAGKTLGIVGMGNIGTRVALRARAFEMQLLICDPYIPASHVTALGGRWVGLEQIFAESDFVTMHCPLNKETRHMVSTKQFGLMKKSAFLVNLARGGVVDEQALVEALREKRIAGAAIDVMETEPPAKDHPLLGLDNVLMTPHLGGSTRESQESGEWGAAQEVARVLQGEAPQNPVIEGKR